jgi:hypothetical protein
MMVDDVDVPGHVLWVRWVHAWIAKHRPKKVYMRTSTRSGNDRYGAKQFMTKKWRQTEHDKKEKWR